MYCPGRNATDPIWRVLVSSDGLSSWTPLKPQHSNPNPLANQLWSIDFLTPATFLIIPHRLPAFLESLMPLKNRCSIHARCSKSSLKHSIGFCGLFSKFKTEFYCTVMPIKYWCSIHARCSKSSLKHPIRFCGIFSKFKTELYCISW